MAARVRMSLTGPLVLEVGGNLTDVSALGPLGSVALAFLVSERHRPVSKDELAEVIWGEELPATWEPSLRGLITRIRRRLREAGVPGEVIVGGHGHYRLSLPAPTTVDVEEAVVAVEAARHALANGRFVDARELSGEALAVARTPFLGGGGGTWGERRQAQLDELRLTALELLSEAASGCGDHATAIAAADEAVAAQPLREAAHLRAMQARAAAGNRADALRAYERCRQVLAEELGVSPSQRTEAVYLELLRDNEPAPADPPLTNLTAELSSFVGRTDEVRDVQKLLGTTRLATLLGPGGVGKTRLAIRVAAGLVNAHRDGVWLVELASLSDPHLLAQHVASTLKISETPSSGALESLRGYLAGRQLLLVLDNCEHLASACAVLVRDLLAASSGLVVVATSRTPLGVIGESLWPVPPLSLPAQLAVSPNELQQSEAVRLFLERAAGVDPAFALTSENGSAVVAICYALDGLPLAIELAAARTRSLSVADIAARLQDRFRLLVGSDPTAPDRHRTLRAAVDWSYEALPPSEQAVFRRMSVFAGGFGLDAADAVCGQGVLDVLDTLTALVDASLVVADRSGSETRFRLLETLRQYASERLASSPEASAVEGRHSGWACALAERAEQELEGANQQAWLQRLDRDEDNVRAALDRAILRPDDDTGLRTAGALWRYWQVRSRYHEGQRWLRALLDVDPGVSPAVRAKALSAAAILKLTESQAPLSDPDADLVRTLLEESLAIRRKIGDQRGVASVLHGLAGMHHRRWERDKALACFEETLAIGRELGEKRLIAASLVNMATAGADDPIALLEEGVQLWRELGDDYATARALGDLSGNVARKHQFEYAAALLEEAAAIQLRLGDRTGLAATHGALGTLARRQAKAEEARVRFEESLAIYQELDNPFLVAMGIDRLAYLSWTEGDLAEARRRWQHQATIGRTIELKLPLQNALEGLAGLALIEGDFDEARRRYEEADEVSRNAHDLKSGGPWHCVSLAMLALAEGLREEAVHHCWHCLAQFANSPHRPSVTFATALDVLAVLSAQAGDLDLAATLVGAADTSRDDPFTPFRARPEYCVTLAAVRELRTDRERGLALPLEDAVHLAGSTCRALERRFVANA